MIPTEGVGHSGSSLLEFENVRLLATSGQENFWWLKVIGWRILSFKHNHLPPRPCASGMEYSIHWLPPVGPSLGGLDITYLGRIAWMALSFRRSLDLPLGILRVPVRRLRHGSRTTGSSRGNAKSNITGHRRAYADLVRPTIDAKKRLRLLGSSIGCRP